MGWWQRLLGGGPRTSGAPPSANGASSFHLRWDLPDLTAAGREAVGAEVTLEVLHAPAVDRLYFWALQADVADGSGRSAGGAHLGLQWHPEHPGRTAVNWGGYDAGGRVLDGSASALRSATGNPHTRDLRWNAGTPYVLRIERHPDAPAPPGCTAWRGTVTGPDGDVVVRDLYPEGDRLAGVIMWSEVFARCDDPPVSVRWSRPAVLLGDGSALRPAVCATSYQSHIDGGCANTDQFADATGLVQATNRSRATPPGALLRVPA
ncbi:MAG: hypothetical protein ACOYOP_07595 [Microthrixaceae bacterium]